MEFEPVIYDCQSDSAICVQHARGAVTSEELSAVIGPIVSADILPSAEVTERAKVPHLVMAVLNQITDAATNRAYWSSALRRSSGGRH